MEFSLIVLLALLSFLISWTGNVFMSLMYAVMLFVNATLVLLSLGFEFLALVNMLVYVGALAVLFLFVIMLLEIPSAELRAYYRGYSVLTFFGLIVVLIKQFGVALPFGSPNSQGAPYIYSFNCTSESISNIGVAFYIRYADVLILNSLVLTIALFGALVLAHSRS
uniref:NADH-ubiquinone oxidoreductase chain 6 n=1 Tax=Chlorogonium elongatum TaxID=52029 RepID=O79863_9CHLO|nr:NADH dehydrogenase subunit 6 [Chlorogonium elongatum]